jgi:photosystem II stability/assembly factor-like uncharacterized protein
MRFLLFFLLSLACAHILSQNPVRVVPGPSKSSFRGLAVVNDSTWWVSGQNNTVMSTVDGGLHWRVFSVGDTARKTDFRDIQVLKNGSIIVAGATNPACIYMSRDNGASWQLAYNDTAESGFIDGIDFWDNDHGIALCDPISNTWQLLVTHDGGKSWEKLPAASLPAALPNEAAFAASGTAIRVTGKNEVVFVTGGSDFARILISKDRGLSWKPYVTNVAATKSSGLFSACRNSAGKLVCTGGDYSVQADSLNNITILGSIRALKNHPRGYRCAVTRLRGKTLIATGDNGTDISHDDGLSWEKLSDEGFYTVSCTGSTCVFSGKGGKIGTYKLR